MRRPATPYQLRSWLVDDYNWARLALPCALILLTSLPVVLTAENRPLILLVTLLPAYMIHQYEEHAHGRFVAFFNATICRGRDVLTPVSAFWINILDVWLVFLVAFYLAKYWTLGVSLFPVYVILLNAATHVTVAVRLRRYDPGLITSLVLFLPWGGYLLIYFHDAVDRIVLVNGVALGAAVLVHAIIIVYVVRTYKRLEAGH